MDWKKLKGTTRTLLKQLGGRIDDGQRNAVNKVVNMLIHHGVILADEVGLGKTRVSLVIMEAVMRCGGTVASVVPPGLMYQWEQEANKVFKDIDDSKIKGNVVRLRKFENLFKEKNFPILNPFKNNKWILASHNFGFWQRLTDNNENYDLFTLIKAKKDEWQKIAKNIEARNSDLVPAADFLLRYSNVKNNPVWNDYPKPYSSTSLRDRIFLEGPGKALVYTCIRRLMGFVDLLVVDEAHKSREEKTQNGNLEKRLSVLLEMIIGRNETQRRICMTATPIELSSEQWNDLLYRCMLPKFSGTDNCIIRFENALHAAKINPENGKILQELIDSSKRYGRELSRYVIRRKRTNNKDYRQRISKLKLDDKKLNPHIDIKECEISPESLDNRTQGNWKRALFCFEGLSAACQGITDVPLQTKLMRCRYASGLMNSANFSESIAALDDSCQRKRIKFWYELAQQLTSGDDGCSDLYSHPRIKEAAWAIRNEVKTTKEKVLVFGTFKKPIMVLRNVLNALYVIDCAIHGYPTSLMGLNENIVKKVYLEYKDKFEKSLRRRGHSFELKKALEKCQNKNANLLKRLSKKFNNQAICKSLHLEGLSDSEMEELGRCVRSDMVDALRFRKMNSRLKSDSKPLEDEVYTNICYAYNNGLSDQLKTETEQKGDGGSNGINSSRKAKILDALGLGEREDDDVDTSRRRSAFCRLMDGDMKMSTRRIVQELFNDENAFPKVLIAQSSVGREGLNLQGACRNVFIFHPEWNPAVIEQEIGRVDRIGSLWEKKADEYAKRNGSKKSAPKIKATFVVFKGPYDEHQYKVYLSRKELLSSQLSGVLLEDESEKIPDDYKAKLEKASPNFEP